MNMKQNHRLTGRRIGAAATLAAVTTLAGAALAPAAFADSTVATHSTAAPDSNVHLGQILAQVPHSGNKCSEKAQATPVHVSVTGTAARPNAYVNVTANAKCQLVVSKIAYGVGASTATGGASATTGSAAKTGAAVAPQATAASVCTRETKGLLSEKSGGIVVGTVTSQLNYRQNCTWGSIIAASASEISYTSGWGLGAGYSFFNEGFALNSVTTSAMVTTANFFMEYAPTTVQAEGALQVKNTSRANGSIVANCSWDPSIPDATGGDTMVCQVQRVS
jgi:hypothetical protein